MNLRLSRENLARSPNGRVATRPLGKPYMSVTPARHQSAAGGPPIFLTGRSRCRHDHRRLATAALTAVVSTAAARPPSARLAASVAAACLAAASARRQPPLGGSLRSAAASSAAASSAAAASPLPPLRSPTPHRSPRSAAVGRQRRSQMLRRSSRSAAATWPDAAAPRSSLDATAWRLAARWR